MHAPRPRAFAPPWRNLWCGRRESNPYDRSRGILSPLRLPVSPRPLAALGFNGARKGRQVPLWPPHGKARLTSSALARSGDRRLKTQAEVPREIDPGVLRYLGNEGIDECAPQRLGIDRCDTRLGQDLARALYSRAVSAQPGQTEQPPPASARGLLKIFFYFFSLPLFLPRRIPRDTDCLDDP